ncbi:MAG TPA: CBS domain-containing protein, partial [Myxococcota bacterium]|nr:CBS domain-containing protein [Myxococcota bacterium]
MLATGHSRYPVCREGRFELLGWVMAKDVLKPVLEGQKPAFETCLQPPTVVPENMPALDLLETFRDHKTHIAFVVSQYGGIEGLVTPTDVLDELAGKLSPFSVGEDSDIVVRPDGSLLVDGLLDLGSVEDALGVSGQLTEDRDAETVAGLILRKGHRLRLVLARGSHDRPYLIAQLQFETALIAPDGECGLIRRARQCATQAAFAHLPQQQA